MTQIIPAILATSEEEYKTQVEQVNLIASDLDGWVHIDFADNIFVQNKTVGLDIVRKYPVSLKKEAHLMVQDPGSMLDELIDAGFERIVIHVESEDVMSNLSLAKSLAINCDTSLDVAKLFLNDIEGIVLMGIKAGFQGQEFIPEVIEKIKAAKKLRLRVEVDGGITLENARMIVDAGADSLVIGSHLLNGDVKQNLEKFKQILK